MIQCEPKPRGVACAVRIGIRILVMLTAVATEQGPPLERDGANRQKLLNRLGLTTGGSAGGVSHADALPADT
jgi:hypothetical protein